MVIEKCKTKLASCLLRDVLKIKMCVTLCVHTILMPQAGNNNNTYKKGDVV